MKLPLRNRAGDVIGVALVDDDFPYAEHRWSVANTGYVQGFVDGRVVHLHRVVMGLKVGDRRIVDHINRDRFDNRSANLRIVTPGESSQNGGGRVTWRGHPVTSSYRGVSWSARYQKWVAQCQINGKQNYLGRYEVEAEAAAVALAYRQAHMAASQD